MESPDCVGREGSHDGVQNASVMEEHEVLLRPVVWVDQLHQIVCDQQIAVPAIALGSTFGAIAGRCIP
jgi:hypothetical protein